MFSDKLLSPVSKQSAFLATFFQFKRKYIEALLQKHLLCQAKLEILGCVSLLFFSLLLVFLYQISLKNTVQRHTKWHMAL